MEKNRYLVVTDTNAKGIFLEKICQAHANNKDIKPDQVMNTLYQQLISLEADKITISIKFDLGTTISLTIPNPQFLIRTTLPERPTDPSHETITQKEYNELI